MSAKHLHRTKFRSENMLDRLTTIQMTGKGPTSLSFLPDDSQREGMDIETVALLPVLRRLEVMVGGKGAASSVPGLRMLLEHLRLREVQTNPMISVSEDVDNPQQQQPLSEKNWC